MSAIPQEAREEAIERVLEAIPDAPPTVGLRKICEDAGVKAPTFLLWVSQDEKLAERYARAMEFRTEADVDRINEISMAPAEMIEGKFGICVDSGDVALRRLQVDSLKWLIVKRLPKKYGDRVALDHAGKIDTTAPDLSKLSAEELAALRGLTAKAQPDAPADS